MQLGFEDNDEIFQVRVETGNVLLGHSGYRKGNFLILSKDTFKQWHYALMASDFSEMRRIIDGVIDIDTYRRDVSKASHNLLSYNIADNRGG